ncbi:MAG TPA: hypothetical protein VGC39_04845, partial [Candidatus Methylacidiphilales bacterium]
MRPVTFHQILAGSGTALLIFGCAILCPGRALSAEDDTANTGSSFDNVEILTPSLNAKLAILRVGSDRTDTDLLSVFVGLKNKTARRLEFQMQTLYKDKAGNQLNTGRASWVPMTLKPHEESEYRSASISE